MVLRSTSACEHCGAVDGMHSMAYCLKIRELNAEIASLREQLAVRREQISQAFDAIDGRHMHKTKRFTKYPCPCGAMISNSGHAAASHLRGSIHRQNMERKALGLDPI